jgi:phosphoglycolate phosphatase-like HAD superfamily hydrolase
MELNTLILFDIDGTLLRGAGSHHKDALIEAIRRVTGVTCSFEGIDTSGRLDRDLIRTLLASSFLSQRRIQRDMPRIILEAQLCYQQSCTIDLRPKVLPGVVKALNELQRRQIPLALVTGNLTAIAWHKLELAGLRDYFAFGAFAEQGRTRARLAQLAAWQAKRRGLVKPGCAVTLIGDHANDIAAAKANGFKAIAVATGIMPLEELRLHSPDLLLENLTQLPFDSLFALPE